LAPDIRSAGSGKVELAEKLYRETKKKHNNKAQPTAAEYWENSTRFT